MELHMHLSIKNEMAGAALVGDMCLVSDSYNLMKEDNGRKLNI